MAQQIGSESSPKKETSLSLVTGFYHYLRGKCVLECLGGKESMSNLKFDGRTICRLTESLYVCVPSADEACISATYMQLLNGQIVRMFDL